MEVIFDVLESALFANIIGDITLYSILSTALKFIFVIIVLVFIYKIVRMITMDVRVTLSAPPIQADFLKLLSDPLLYDYPIKNEYYLSDNTTIGRADDNTIVIKDRQMSKYQARIIQNQGLYFIDDLGSTNPTMVNGYIISQPTQLNSHDVITVGGIDFAFVDGGRHAKQTA